MDITEQIRRTPKVSLHDHLDGGLRPETILDLAPEAGVDLPEQEATALGRWFFEQANAGSLEAYLTTFRLTVGVMQTYENIRRVARESVVDQAEDGVVYSETRWAPCLHTAGGLSEEDAVRAVRDGIAEGTQEALAKGSFILVRQILCEMRGKEPTEGLADLAIAYRDDSVVGLDCAGPEKGYSTSTFASAYETARRANMFVTIHAGEADGLDAIHEAVHACGAHRIGHGVRLIDDISFPDGVATLGRLAQYIATLRIPLEISPTSNLQTGVAPDLAHHPFDDLYRAGIRVTVNCDNRLMSATSLSKELSQLASTFGYTMGDIRRFTFNAAKSAFLDWDEKRALIHEVIAPGYLGAQTAAVEAGDWNPPRR